MPKVLAISSQVVWGPVGNTAAVPALQAAGHEVLQVPTILLSHHPGHGRPVAQRTDAGFMAELLDSVAAKGGLAGCGGVLTGYFASAAQINVAANVIGTLKRENPALVVLIDPVIGDGAALYVPEEVATAVRDQFVPLATILTPNVFELSWLSGKPVSDEASAKSAANALGCPEVLATSLPVSATQIGNLLIAGDESELSASVRLAKVPHGTGDFLAGAYLAQRLTKPPRPAFAAAMVELRTAIMASKGQDALKTQ